jgi:hypothetical protein
MNRQEFMRRVEAMIDDASGGTHNSVEWWSDRDVDGEPCTPIIKDLVEMIANLAEKFRE